MRKRNYHTRNTSIFWFLNFWQNYNLTAVEATWFRNVKKTQYANSKTRQISKYLRQVTQKYPEFFKFKQRFQDRNCSNRFIFATSREKQTLKLLKYWKYCVWIEIELKLKSKLIPTDTQTVPKLKLKPELKLKTILIHKFKLTETETWTQNETQTETYWYPDSNSKWEETWNSSSNWYSHLNSNWKSNSKW